MAFTQHTGPPYVTPITPKPKGTTRETDTHTSGTCGGTPPYETIVSHTPADGVVFSLAKILVTWSGDNEQHIRVKIGDEVIGEYYATDYVMDWFPPGTDLVGDDEKKVVIEACAATGEEATLTGFIVGEER